MARRSGIYEMLQIGVLRDSRPQLWEDFTQRD